jgi:hypothetical protein
VTHGDRCQENGELQHPVVRHVALPALDLPLDPSSPVTGFRFKGFGGENQVPGKI